MVSLLSQCLVEVLGDTSLPPHTFNTALHLAASLVLVGGGRGSQWDAWGEEFVGAVCGRGREEDGEEVGLVLGFFRELAKDLERFKEVCSWSGH